MGGVDLLVSQYLLALELWPWLWNQLIIYLFFVELRCLVVYVHVHDLF